jgi:ribosome-binding protein aMBF1 (putative translation factor)
MNTAVKKSKSVVRSRRRSKAKPMTKAEMVQKMLADQKIIREARQKGISYEELEKTHGFKFARLPHLQNQ